MIKFLLVIYLFSILFSQSLQQKTSCEAKTYYKLMSSKTDYDLVANTGNFYDYEIPGKYKEKPYSPKFGYIFFFILNFKRLSTNRHLACDKTRSTLSRKKRD